MTRDLRNIVSREMGMASATGPAVYETNEVPPVSGFATYSSTRPSADSREKAVNALANNVNWMGSLLYDEGDLTGALLAALLVRRLVPHDDVDRTLGFSPARLYMQLQAAGLRAFGLGSPTALLPDFTRMLEALQHMVDGS